MRIPLILAALAVLAGPCWGLDRRLLAGAGMQELSQEAPDLTLLSPSGKKITLRENRGKVVIIHIWATWCKPCKEEFPLFERMYRGFRDSGVVFLPVAIDTRAGAKEIEAHAKALGATFEVYAASEGDITERYWSWGVPVTYFVDKKGRIVARAIGPRDWGSEAVRALVQALADER